MLFLVLASLLQSTPPVRTVDRGPTSDIDSAARQVTVRTAEEWSTLWRAHAPNRPLPPVDFSREMVVGVFLGGRPSGGYSVEIVRTVEQNGALVVQFVETPAARGALTAQILTAPYHIVAISKRAGEVRFEKVEK
jgi:hypothetical protein